MGFSALDGLPMGTRCGSLDAGVVFYMLREMGLTPAEAEHMLYTRSGLLGVSGLSNDMRALRAQAGSNQDARTAIDLFVYRIGRELGSLIAALGASMPSCSPAASARTMRRHAPRSCAPPHGPGSPSTSPPMPRAVPA